MHKAEELLRALASHTRIAIIQILDPGPLCVHALNRLLNDRLTTVVAQPLVSQHLKILREAGLIKGTVRGRETLYAMTDNHVGHIVDAAIAVAKDLR